MGWGQAGSGGDADGGVSVDAGNVSRAVAVARGCDRGYIRGMASVAFDTHKFVKELTGAGMDVGQAEVLARNYADLLVDRLATKDDLKALEQRFSDKMEAQEERLTGRMEAQEERLTGRIDGFQKDMESLEERLTNLIERSQTRTIITVTGLLGFLILTLEFYG